MARPDVSSLAGAATNYSTSPGSQSRRRAGNGGPRPNRMPAVISEQALRGYALSEAEESPRTGGTSLEPQACRPEMIGPNALVRWAFYLSAFSIPFTRVYLPGTGERVGVLVCGGNTTAVDFARG